jgi:hypothetical protein
MNERAGNGSDGRRKTRQDDKREGMLSGATSAIGSVFFGIPKFLFDQYVHLPGPIRTVMYIAFFLVFVYLLTLPRFLDGQLIVRDANSGGLLPYRGVDLQMQVEGRPYKFRSNEEGFFSVPIVGRWPGALDIQIFHEDRRVWFDVKFSVADQWSGGNHRIEVLADKPFVRLAQDEANEAPGPLALVAQMLLSSVGSAHAQAMVLPKNPQTESAQLSSRERAAIRQTVERIYADVVRKPPSAPGSPSLLAGRTKDLSYVQRIQLISAIEKQFQITIPDEHWQQMEVVAQLADYVEKRKQLERSTPASRAAVKGATSWAVVQKEFPASEKPVYAE